MARAPLTTFDDKYHDTLNTFAESLARNQRRALADAGITGSQAEDVIGAMLFDFAMMFDHGGSYKVDGKLKPKLCFQDQLGQLQVPHEATHLHEYAFGIAGQLFDEEADQ